MHDDSPLKALLAVLLTALICSSLVSAAVVVFRPLHRNNQILEQSRNIMQLTGLLPGEKPLSNDEMLALYNRLDVRIVDIDGALFNEEIDPLTFDPRRAVNDPVLGIGIPAELDRARLGRRSRFAPVYMVLKEGSLERLILPVNGTGMWSTIYGYIALEADLNTIAGVTFYQQNETPGLGDQIMRPAWQAQWKGRRIYDEAGGLRFGVSQGRVESGSATALHEVDALTGATVTADAVTAMVRYWFGPHGYQDFLDDLRERENGVD